MLLDTQLSPPPVHNLPTSTPYRVEINSSLMFELISGIASDKLKYPCREIYYNAWDASPGKVKVTLPSIFASSLIIRDFGPGMSSEEIESRFIVIGASSKRQDPNAIGNKGLGCKSPFAYSRKFSVISHNGDTTTTWQMFLNEDNAPQAVLVSSTPRTAPTGLEIMIPIRKEDHRRTAELFTEIEWHINNPAPVGSILIPPRGGVVRHVTLQVGPVPYEIDFAYVPYWARQRADVIAVPIGAVSVTSSRELLSYDKKTLECLTQAFSQAQLKAGVVIQAAIDAQPDYLSAHAIYKEMRGEHFGPMDYKGKGLKVSLPETKRTFDIKTDRFGRHAKYHSPETPTSGQMLIFDGGLSAVSAHRRVQTLIREKGGKVRNAAYFVGVLEELPKLCERLGVTPADFVILKDVPLEKRTIVRAVREKGTKGHIPLRVTRVSLNKGLETMVVDTTQPFFIVPKVTFEKGKYKGIVLRRLAALMINHTTNVYDYVVVSDRVFPNGVQFEAVLKARALEFINSPHIENQQLKESAQQFRYMEKLDKSNIPADFADFLLCVEKARELYVRPVTSSPVDSIKRSLRELEVIVDDKPCTLTLQWDQLCLKYPATPLLNEDIIVLAHYLKLEKDAQ